MIPYDWLLEAQERVRPYLHTTPLTRDPDLDIFLKWENRQVTGSFKARGALNKVLGLERWEREAGLVAASAGNHGQGVALAGRVVQAPVKIFVGETAPQMKIERIRALGAEVIQIPGGYGDAEQAGLEQVASIGGTWISPYNDGHVIAGQGTVALEILEQLPALMETPAERFTWVVPAGGGGLVAGIGAALSRCNPRPRLVAVQTDTSPFLHALFHQGTQVGVVERPTLADGLAGPLEEGSITIPLTRELVDDVLLVSEEEVEAAIWFAWQKYNERIEGSAAVALAAILSGKIHQRPAVITLTGGNIQDNVFDQITQKPFTIGRSPLAGI